MHQERSNRLSRRSVVAGGSGVLGMAAMHALRGHASAAPIIQAGGGIAGGGSIRVDDGAAHFIVFGSRFVEEGVETPLIFGQLRFVDLRQEMTFESIEVSDYGPIEGGDENARRMTGTVTLNGIGVHPFALTMVDVDGPGTNLDTIDFAVGADGAADTNEPIYAVNAPLRSGDLQLLTFEFPE